MGFDNNQFKPEHREPIEAGGNQLDSLSVCREGHDARQFTRTGTASDYLQGSMGDRHCLELLSNNDAVVASVLRSLNSIQEKYDSLPPEYQKMVQASFAQHMTGSEYPAYDYMRSMA